MHRVRLLILWLTLILAWSAFEQIWPREWWLFEVTLAGAIVLAYPLWHAAGLPDRRYAGFAAVAFVAAVLLQKLSESTGLANNPAAAWTTAAILLFAFAGYVITTLRRRHVHHRHS